MNNKILIPGILVCLGLANLTFAQDAHSNYASPGSAYTPVCTDCIANSNKTERSPILGFLRDKQPARNTEGRYRSFFGGWNLLEDQVGDVSQSRFRDGFIAGYARGRHIKNNNRLELESTWQNTSGSLTPAGLGFDGHYSSLTTMVNLLHDFNPNGALGFYAGGGIGLARQNADFISSGVELELDEYAFAYQGIAGVNYRVTDHGSDLYLEYRYSGNTDTDIEAADAFFDTFEFSAQNIVFGIRIKR